MSVSDPLLKELKSATYKLIQHSASDSINDQCPFLMEFCQTTEKIFQRGLLSKQAESWFWLEHISHYCNNYPYVTCVENVRTSTRCRTSKGRLRLLIRSCLDAKCLHIPVEILVRSSQPQTYYSRRDSIIGDPILGEIFLSVLLQSSRLPFKLEIGNCAFLDDTWVIPEYYRLELVPCSELGLCVTFVSGKAIIARVEPNSVSAETDKISLGDILDEINGTHIGSHIRGKLGKLMKKAHGKPVEISIIKVFIKKSEEMFQPIVLLLRRTNIDITELKASHLYPSRNIEDSSINSSTSRPGYAVTYLGKTSTGDAGDVKKIQPAIHQILSSGEVTLGYGKNEGSGIKVQLEVLETGVRVTRIDNGEIVFNHSYINISSCGMGTGGTGAARSECFAYIKAPEEKARKNTEIQDIPRKENETESFTAYVYHCSKRQHIQDILHGLGQGFQRMHFAV